MDEQDQTNDLTETEGTTATVPRTRKRKPKTISTKISGAALTPDLDSKDGGSLQEYVYWIGVIPSCPVEHIVSGGQNFPKAQELIVNDPSKPSGKARVPVFGGFARFTDQSMRTLLERLPRLVIRFKTEDTGDGAPRKGHLIRIPTDEEVKHNQQAGRGTRHYRRHKFDEPASRYMFAVLCENQDQPERGSSYPDVLEKTGIMWPEEIEV